MSQDPNSDPLVPVFVPALVTLLKNREAEKGQPLTEDEVDDVRGTATVVVVKRSRAEEMARSRGFADLDPVNLWSEWQAARSRNDG